VSTSDEVRLHGELVRTDLEYILRLRDRIEGAPMRRRAELVAGAAELIRGEFIEDLRYENWATRLQLVVHNDVRRLFLPIVEGTVAGIPSEERALVGSALLRLDPFDEPALVALAQSFAISGRRVAARRVLEDYAARLRSDLDDEPSEKAFAAAALVGADLGVKEHLTLRAKSAVSS
jgi:DNA-binding SARP family transcriptional activator